MPPKNYWSSSLNSVKFRIQNQYAEICCIFIHNKELSEREIKKTTPFMIASKRTKYLGINLTKNVKGLHSVKQQTLMKETEDDTEEKIQLVHRWEELILLK